MDYSSRNCKLIKKFKREEKPETIKEPDGYVESFNTVNNFETDAFSQNTFDTFSSFGISTFG